MIERRSGRWRQFLYAGAIALIAVVLSAFLASLDLNTANQIASIGSLLLAFGVAGVTGYVYLGSRVKEAPQPLSSDLIDDLLDELSDSLARDPQLSPSRGGQSLPRLNLRWKDAPSRLADHRQNIVGETSGPYSFAGNSSDLLATYDGVPSGRLVLLGAAGAGKSALIEEFDFQYLMRRRENPAAVRYVPIPLYLSTVSAFATQQFALRDFVVSSLHERFPYLGTTTTLGSTWAERLFDSGRLLPLLDGFDELTEPHRRQLARTLNQSTLPFILTSRIAEYDAMITSTGAALRGAAAVVITELEFSDIKAYLELSTGTAEEGQNKWGRLLSRIERSLEPRPFGRPEDKRARTVLKILSNPLMVTLAAKIYGRSGQDPDELTDRPDLEEQDSLVVHLLGALIPSAFTAADEQLGTVGDFQRWLGCLAVVAKNYETVDIRWWTLDVTVPTAVRLTFGLILATIFGGIILSTLAVLGHYGFGRYSETYSIASTAFLFLEYVAGGLFAARVTPSNRVFRRRRRRLDRFEWRQFSIGFGVGLLTQLGAGLSATAALWFQLGPVQAVTNGFVAAGLTGPFIGLFFGFVAASRRPADLTRLSSPRTALRNDRTAAIMLAIGGSPMLAMSLTAWGRLQVTRIYCWIRGRLPWRILMFLDVSLSRGILRQVGPAYQFRHIGLRDYLVTGGTDMFFPND